MAKLYFKYGTMGASKSAQALIAKFNYEENGKKVLLIKPAIDTRDGVSTIKSRIGLEAAAVTIKAEDDITMVLSQYDHDVVIADESQFFTPAQIDGLHMWAVINDKPVLCYGLKTDFQTNFFPGSRRLMEVAESLHEIKMVCECGAKATVNARLDGNGCVVLEGAQVALGGNECYKALCFRCYAKKAGIVNNGSNR